MGRGASSIGLILVGLILAASGLWHEPSLDRPATEMRMAWPPGIWPLFVIGLLLVVVGIVLLVRPRSEPRP